jgi:hypothetical protein
MKLCWDNINQLKYNKKNGKWYKFTKAYTLKDHCKVCNEPFLSKADDEIFCSNICSTLRFKIGLKKLKQSFENEGYSILEESYINSKTKMKTKCPYGHLYKTSWNIWQRGHRCPHCSGNAKKIFEKIKQLFESEKYILLSTEYKNWNSKLKYKCPKGHINSITWSNWKNGRRCPQCSFLDGKSSIEK